MPLKICPCGRYKYVHPAGNRTETFEGINGNKYPRFIEYESDCRRTWELDVYRNVWR